MGNVANAKTDSDDEEDDAPGQHPRDVVARCRELHGIIIQLLSDEDKLARECDRLMVPLGGLQETQAAKAAATQPVAGESDDEDDAESQEDDDEGGETWPVPPEPAVPGAAAPVAPPSPGDETAAERRIMPRELQRVTQCIIDRLGCRHPATLQRVSAVYSMFAGRRDGLNDKEFRGYVACILTQFLRELETRCAAAGMRITDEEPEDAARSTGKPGQPAKGQLPAVAGLYASYAPDAWSCEPAEVEAMSQPAMNRHMSQPSSARPGRQPSAQLQAALPPVKPAPPPRELTELEKLTLQLDALNESLSKNAGPDDLQVAVSEVQPPMPVKEEPPPPPRSPCIDLDSLPALVMSTVGKSELQPAAPGGSLSFLPVDETYVSQAAPQQAPRQTCSVFQEAQQLPTASPPTVLGPASTQGLNPGAYNQQVPAQPFDVRPASRGAAAELPRDAQPAPPVGTWPQGSATTPEVAGVSNSDEKRLDTDGQPYTKLEFATFYGEAYDWKQRWESAKPAEAGAYMAVETRQLTAKDLGVETTPQQLTAKDLGLEEAQLQPQHDTAMVMQAARHPEMQAQSAHLEAGTSTVGQPAPYRQQFGEGPAAPSFPEASQVVAVHADPYQQFFGEQAALAATEEAPVVFEAPVPSPPHSPRAADAGRSLAPPEAGVSTAPAARGLTAADLGIEASAVVTEEETEGRQQLTAKDLGLEAYGQKHLQEGKGYGAMQKGKGNGPVQERYGHDPAEKGKGHGPMEEGYGSGPVQEGYSRGPMQKGKGTVPMQEGYGHGPMQKGKTNGLVEKGTVHGLMQKGKGHGPMQEGYDHHPNQETAALQAAESQSATAKKSWLDRFTGGWKSFADTMDGIFVPPEDGVVENGPPRSHPDMPVQVPEGGGQPGAHAPPCGKGAPKGDVAMHPAAWTHGAAPNPSTMTAAHPAAPAWGMPPARPDAPPMISPPSHEDVRELLEMEGLSAYIALGGGRGMAPKRLCLDSTGSTLYVLEAEDSVPTVFFGLDGFDLSDLKCIAHTAVLAPEVKPMLSLEFEEGYLMMRLGDPQVLFGMLGVLTSASKNVEVIPRPDWS